MRSSPSLGGPGRKRSRSGLEVCRGTTKEKMADPDGIGGKWTLVTEKAPSLGKRSKTVQEGGE